MNALSSADDFKKKKKRYIKKNHLREEKKSNWQKNFYVKPIRKGLAALKMNLLKKQKKQINTQTRTEAGS